MTTLVGLWNCTYCSTKGIPGYIYDCQNCGHPRSRNVKFYLPAKPIPATIEQIELIGNDPNWYCTYCDSGNKQSNNDCWNCGGERGNAPSHKVTDGYTDETVPREGD